MNMCYVHVHCQKSISQEFIWVLSWNFQRMVKGRDHLTQMQYGHATATITAPFTTYSTITSISTTCKSKSIETWAPHYYGYDISFIARKKELLCHSKPSVISLIWSPNERLSLNVMPSIFTDFFVWRGVDSSMFFFFRKLIRVTQIFLRLSWSFTWSAWCCSPAARGTSLLSVCDRKCSRLSERSSANL